MAAYGGSTTFFALSLSRISKYTGRHFLLGVAGLVNLGVLITLYAWTPTPDSLIIIFVIPIIWGIAEGIWQTQSNGKIYLSGFKSHRRCRRHMVTLPVFICGGRHQVLLYVG